MKLIQKLSQHSAPFILAGAFILTPNVASAVAAGGFNSYTPNTPNGSSQTVSCNSGITPVATAGVITAQNTTTVGNNVTVNIVNGTCQEAYQALTSTTVMATYTVGL
ncbi:hypothetical protein [Polynucleobacter sp. AP-Nino-20-G2]|uniref:hypothetical protein n=1 Tax=Polynucleobacter sp. AP-Nino-20-G2 TaxID=2576917 RepID=UPI001BFE1AF6|nr:hypothetical protein [Polynucleobacter sp. AP-Nino-20-G2]QWE16059.1 hypothetical protein FD960_07125 [Polynucleobacter sp. AP-Nino-20-G2]